MVELMIQNGHICFQGYMNRAINSAKASLLILSL